MTETNSGWVRTWSAAPQTLDRVDDAKPTREVRISGGGRRVRLRFTNEYGTTPLTIGGGRIGDGHVLSFGGRPGAVVPVGAPILSDPVDLVLPPLARLPIDVETAAPLSAVEVAPDGPATVLVAIGDSLTAGFGAEHGWTERLAERAGGALYVCNQGISGNRLLNDGIGPSALARFDRDVLATPGLTHVVVAEGLNDVSVATAPPSEFLALFPGGPVTAEDVIAAHRQLIDRAHGHGVRVFGATMTPYEGLDLFTAAGERVRQEVNAWIRGSGAYDAVLDFDAVWRDPSHPSRIRDDFHAGDHLHGNDAGYRALADAVDLSMFS